MKLTNIAKTVLDKRYLRMKDDGTKETPDELLRRVAHTIADVDRRYGETGDNVAQACKHLRRGQSQMYSLPSQLARLLEGVASDGVEFPCTCANDADTVTTDPHDGIRRLAEAIVNVGKSQGSKCPSCGEKTVVRESGCPKCTSCGWSKCG